MCMGDELRQSARLWCTAGVFVCVALVVGVAAPARAEGPAEADPWTSYILANRWEQGEKAFAAAIVEECARTGGPSFEELARLHFAWQVCRYFPAVERGVVAEGDRRTLVAWLLESRGFTERLLLALGPRDDPAAAFRIVYQLLGRSQARVKEFPELAIAFAVVWDGYEAGEGQLLEAFRYYTRNADRMRFDLRTMPHQVAKYVIDTQRAASDLTWALESYAGRSDMGPLYDGIYRDNYDRAVFLQGKPKEISRHASTLPNLLRYGGVCEEAAVFATEVGKAIGVPSVYIRAPVGSGINHAWIGFLREHNGFHVWDCDTGRSSSEAISVGAVIDPQSGRRLSEHELDHALAVMRHPRESRRAARIWCDAARLLQDAGDGPRAKAAIYRSLNTCVYDKSQWATYTHIAREGDFGTRELIKGIDQFCRRLSHYPNLAADAFEELVTAVDLHNVKARVALYQHVASKFARNREALNRVRLLQGRYMEAIGKADQAADIYATSALAGIESKKTMMPLLDNAGRLMLSRGEGAEAVRLHKRVFAILPKPRQGTVATVQTTWFLVGLRLAKLHALAGADEDHEATLGVILAYQTGPADKVASIQRTARGLSYRRINRTFAPGKPER